MLSITSLRTRFVAIVAPIYVVVCVVVLGAYELHKYRDSYASMTMRLDRLASSQSIILSQAVAEGNSPHLSLMLASVISDRDLIGIAVYGVDGATIDSFGELDGDPELIRQITINHADGTGFKRVGELRLVMSDARILDEVVDDLIFSLLLAFALFVAIMAGALLAYERIIAKPLSQLLNAVSKPQVDDLHTIPWKSKDELGELCGAFNEMISRLDTYKTRLKMEQDDLEARVVARTHELADATKKAEAANLAKTRFLSSMSHELRTPLNAILGFGQMLQYDKDHVLSNLQKRHIEDILKSGNHLVELITEILDFAKIEEGETQFDLEPVPLAELLDECMSMIMPLANVRGTRLTNNSGESTLIAIADYTRLKQAVINLLSNAVKYTPDGGKVSLTVSTLTPKTLRIAVKDTGPGIPTELQDELFEPFSRLGAEMTEIQGTGIGLTITKRIVDLMNGTLGLRSAPGEGSTFWIDLPLADDANADLDVSKYAKSEDWAAPAIKEPQEPSTTSDSGTYRILYIEDHPTNIRLMQTIVAHINGVTLRTVATAEEGLEQALQTAPDLILSDLNLPGMSGFDLILECRKHRQLDSVPVVAISADATDEAMAKAFDVGFARFLTKPVKVYDVLKLLQDLKNGADTGLTQA